MLIALTQVNLRWQNYFAAHQARLAFYQMLLFKTAGAHHAKRA